MDDNMAPERNAQIRLDRIIEIRKALDDGTYSVSALQLADRLLSEGVCRWIANQAQVADQLLD